MLAHASPHISFGTTTSWQRTELQKFFGLPGEKQKTLHNTHFAMHAVLRDTLTSWRNGPFQHMFAGAICATLRNPDGQRCLDHDGPCNQPQADLEFHASVRKKARLPKQRYTSVGEILLWHGKHFVCSGVCSCVKAHLKYIRYMNGWLVSANKRLRCLCDFVTNARNVWPAGHVKTIVRTKPEVYVRQSENIACCMLIHAHTVPAISGCSMLRWRGNVRGFHGL